MPIAPGFHRMGVTEFVEAAVAFQDHGIDPCVVALRAAAHDFAERGVDPRLGVGLLQFIEGRGKRFGDVSTAEGPKTPEGIGAL